MLIDVAFLPQLISPASTIGSVCVVIDVLRATTTLTTLLACGAASVTVAASAGEARAAKLADPGALLLGEIGGLRPADFDLGNSPRDISARLVAGRRAICHTSNGTAAIRAVAESPTVMLGCLRNSAAVARAALAEATRGPFSITIVCSGGAGGRNFALDDALAAGQIVVALLAEADRAELPGELTDAALAARMLRQSAFERADGPADERWDEVLRHTSAGQHLTQIGLGDDIPFCAQVDREATVPLVRAVDGAVLVGAAPLSAALRA